MPKLNDLKQGTSSIFFLWRCNSAMYVRMSFWHMQSRNEGGHTAIPAGDCKFASYTSDTSANAVHSFEFDYTYFEHFYFEQLHQYNCSLDPQHLPSAESLRQKKKEAGCSEYF